MNFWRLSFSSNAPLISVLWSNGGIAAGRNQWDIEIRKQEQTSRRVERANAGSHAAQVQDSRTTARRGAWRPS